MASTWPPTKEADLAGYVTGVSAKLTATPTAYGLIAADATLFATNTTNYKAALALAVDPSTRTAGTVAAKDVMKAILLANLRSLAKRIQANPAVTAQQKSDLGLPIHSAVPSSVPAPVTRPLVAVTQFSQLSQTIHLVDETTPVKRARPAGTSGAEIYVWLGETDAPSDLRKWMFIGIATKASYVINYSDTDAGKQATIAARWFNDKGEVGPLSVAAVAPIAA